MLSVILDSMNNWLKTPGSSISLVSVDRESFKEDNVCRLYPLLITPHKDKPLVGEDETKSETNWTQMMSMQFDNTTSEEIGTVYLCTVYVLMLVQCTSNGVTVSSSTVGALWAL